MRWGQGSLQEIDHVPFVRPLTSFAATAGSTAEIPGCRRGAGRGAARPTGPAFVDLPLDHVFMEAGDETGPRRSSPGRRPPAPDARARARAARARPSGR